MTDPVSCLMPENPRANVVGIGYANSRAKELAGELAKRRIESLQLYEPLPFQEEFHKSKAKEVLLSKGNQTGGAQPLGGLVLTPTGFTRMGDLSVGDIVISGDGSPTTITHIHPRGMMGVYRIELIGKLWVHCTIDHLWKCRIDGGEWDVMSLAAIMKSGKDCMFPATSESGESTERAIVHITAIAKDQCQCITVANADGLYVMENYVVTHNSLCGFAEIARAVTGQDPYDKYPKEDGVAVCVGYGEKHIGRVIHRYLFRAGAFKIIRDEETDMWRVFKPWKFDIENPQLGGDAHRAGKAKLAPPLIPNRFIDGKISWIKRSSNIFDQVRFTTGWTLYIANSSGDVNHCQGFQADLVHIDEDLATPGWHTELTGRLSVSGGPIRWTAVPHAETEDMMNLIHRSEDDADMVNPRTVVISATIYDNPFLSDETREENVRIWKSAGDDVYRQRALGLLTLDSVKMYPGFNKHMHSAIVHLTESEREQEEGGVTLRNPAQRILTMNNGIPPDNWCRYMVVDPGHTICCVSFFAIPPPTVGDYAVMYRQLYLKQCSATMFGEAVQRASRDEWFEDFIIDAHGGALRDIGSGVLPQRQYEQQLADRRVKCARRGSRFMSGSDDIAGREVIMREWLSVRRDGTTKFMYVPERCENLSLEFERFKKITVRNHGRALVTDKGNRRAGTHGIETCEYAAAHGLKYVKPKVAPKENSFVERILAGRRMRSAKLRTQHEHTHGASYVNLGPQGD